MTLASKRGPLAGSTTLVTGGAGFIGSHLVEGLLDSGASRIVVLDDFSLGRADNLSAVRDRIEMLEGDCADEQALLEACGDQRIDLCFNLAVIPLPHSLAHPRENVDRNVAMTTAVCELQRKGRFGRLIQYSSSEVYGTALTVPMDETHPLHPHTPYAAAKAATDLVALSYATTFNLETVLVRPFNTYGERQNEAAYAGLIPEVIKRVRSGVPVTVNGDGKQTRDMSYVGDTVAATLALAGADGVCGETFNIGTGTDVSVNEMIRSLLEALGSPDHPVEHGPGRPGDVQRLIADVERLRAAVGFEPSVSLDEGLRQTVAWYTATAAR